MTPLLDAKHDDTSVDRIDRQCENQDSQNHMRPILHRPALTLGVVQTMHDETKDQLDKVQCADAHSKELRVNQLRVTSGTYSVSTCPMVSPGNLPSCDSKADRDEKYNKEYWHLNDLMGCNPSTEMCQT